MIKSPFLSSSCRTELLSIAKSHIEDHGIARRANALLLLDDGWSCERIGAALFLDDDTVRNWHKQYLAQGWDAVAYDGWKGGQSRMTLAQEAQLCAWLEARFCRSTHEIRARLRCEFGIHYSHSGAVKLMARLGFEYRKPKVLPQLSDTTKQARFIEMYTHLLTQLPADEAVYFAPSRAF